MGVRAGAMDTPLLQAVKNIKEKMVLRTILDSIHQVTKVCQCRILWGQVAGKIRRWLPQVAVQLGRRASSAHGVKEMGSDVSSWNQIPVPRRTGRSASASLCAAARATASPLTPCAVIDGVMNRHPGTNGLPGGGVSRTTPFTSVVALRWKNGGRNVPSVASQRGGNTMRSSVLVPGSSSGALSTVKI